MTDSESPGTLVARFAAVWALLAYAALIVFFAVLRWLLPTDPDGRHTGEAMADVANLETMAAPALAVLLAARVSPVVSGARLAALVALVEYAAILLLGAFALVLDLVAAFIPRGLGWHAAGVAVEHLGELLIGLASLVLVAVAAFWVREVHTSLGGRLRGRRRAGRSAAG